MHPRIFPMSIRRAAPVKLLSCFLSLHSVLQEELQHNIFLRCSDPDLAAAMGKDPGSSTLAELRWRKDNWGLVASATTMALLFIQMLPLAASFFGLDH